MGDNRLWSNSSAVGLTFDETDPTVYPLQLKAPQTFLTPTKRAAKITLEEFVSQVEVEKEQ